MDKSFYSAPSEMEIVAFAEKHLSPYAIRNREIVAKTCPYCNGGSNMDTGTFFVSLDTGQFCCHRGKCGVKGGWIKLLKKFGEAPNIQSVSGQFKPLDLTPLPRTETIDNYFAGRGISTATLDAYQIGADPSGNILFPFYVEGELIYIKYRRSVPTNDKRKEWAQAGAPPVLFGMDLCTPDEPLTITEGQIDALSLYEAGIRNVVSVPTGCDNFQWVEPCYEWLEQFKKIILFGDNDVPGKKMIKTLTTRLGEERCFVIEQYPDGCKDANDILANYGAKTLAECWKNVTEVPIYGAIDVTEIQYVDPTTIPRIKTGIPKLEKAINGLEEGAVTLFTGAPGHGKSTLCGTLLLNAVEQGYHCVAYSGELSPDMFQRWLLLQCAGSEWLTLQQDPITGAKIPVVPMPVRDRIFEWMRGKLYLFDSSAELSDSIADSILNVFQSMAKRKGAKLFVVDNMMTALIDSIEDEYRSQAKFMAELKRFAIRYSAHVIVVAHPRKLKQDATITNDDVSGTKYLTNLASNVIAVEKPDLRVLKNRYSGDNIYIECCYCRDSRRVYQRDVGDKYVYSWNKIGLTPPSIRADSLPEYGVYVPNTQMF